MSINLDKNQLLSNNKTEEDKKNTKIEYKNMLETKEERKTYNSFLITFSSLSLILIPISFFNVLYLMGYAIFNFLYFLTVCIYFYISVKNYQKPQSNLIRISLWIISISVIIQAAIFLLHIFLFIQEKGLNLLQLIEIIPIFYNPLFLFIFACIYSEVCKLNMNSSIALKISFLILNMAIIVLSLFGCFSRLFMNDLAYYILVDNLICFIHPLFCFMVFLYEQGISRLFNIPARKFVLVAMLSYILMIIICSIVSVFLHGKEPLFSTIASYVDSFTEYLKSVVVIKSPAGVVDKSKIPIQ